MGSRISRGGANRPGRRRPRCPEPHATPLRWTNDGALFQVLDISDDFPGSNVNSQAHSSTTAMSAGYYSKIQVNAIGNWTIAIG